MQFSKLLAVATFLANVIANPIAGEGISKLAKRSEGVHLVNCNNVYSVVVYCPNDSDCNHNPPAGDGCVRPGGGTYHWEGSPQSCTFTTGVTFSWNIASNAQSQPNFAYVGSGNNGHGFNIYKDNQHVMYTDGNGYQCKSIYYCLDA
ncbi:hypothetical protein EG329_000089 [Mollisiaceae sp. DMI_Dod_QoI]|nr:hypothetical protein EG329_000089 [Helotiales sp. DMI_Dod_QoI]